MHRNEYLGVALTSENFCQAAVSADYMLNRKDEVRTVVWLNGMQGMFQVSGLIINTVVSGVGTLAASPVFNFCGPDIGDQFPQWLGLHNPV